MASVLEALKRYDSPTLANAVELFDVRPRDEGYMGHEVRCLFPDLGVMVGYAATTDGTSMAGGTTRWGQLRDSDPFVGSVTGKAQPNYRGAFEMRVPSCEGAAPGRGRVPAAHRRSAASGTATQSG